MKLQEMEKINSQMLWAYPFHFNLFIIYFFIFFIFNSSEISWYYSYSSLTLFYSFVSSSETSISQLLTKSNKLESDFKSLLNLYGEEDTVQSEEFFSIPVKFSSDLKVFHFFFSPFLYIFLIDVLNSASPSRKQTKCKSKTKSNSFSFFSNIFWLSNNK